MDAYDIFKKLTKGLRFKNPVLKANTNETVAKAIIKKEKVEVKSEDDLSENDEIRSTDEESDQISENGSDHSNSEVDDELQLVKGVRVGQKTKKKKGKEKTEDLKKKLKLEEQNHFRNEHNIKAVGRHIPAALKEFSDMKSRYGVSDRLVDAVGQCGYSEPTPVQRQALPCMLEGRQILACAPTGSGKTAAFLVPILHALGTPQGGPRALVLCPTRELAVQIYSEALRLSAGTELRCSVVRKMQESKIKEREATIRKSDIVISTPNRLCYLMQQDNVNIKLDKVRWLIIDEADKMFEGSKDEQSDFRQQIDQILAACDGRERRVAMFSATHTPTVAKWCRHNLKGLINITIGQRNAATNLVEQELLYCGNENGKLVAFRQLVHKGLNPPVLVFVQSKERAKQLFKELIYDGINVDVIHADRTQAQRDNVVRSFRVGRVWVLICTELMGRGIDFRGVNLVLNYDFPPSAIAYVHRVGRAGRAGHRGRAITFFTQGDIGNLRSIAAVMKQSGCSVPEFMLQLKQDPNKRRQLMKRAPKRDQISTILKKPEKRKHEDQENGKDSSSKNTESEKSFKYNKHRKIEVDGQFVKNPNQTRTPQKINKSKEANKNVKFNGKSKNKYDKTNKMGTKKKRHQNVSDKNKKLSNKHNKSFVSKKVKNVSR